MKLTARELRGRLFAVLDRVAETGEPVEIVRRGRTLRICREEAPLRTFSVARLRKNPAAIVGDPDELVHLDWSKARRPFPAGGA